MRTTLTRTIRIQNTVTERGDGVPRGEGRKGSLVAQVLVQRADVAPIRGVCGARELSRLLHRVRQRRQMLRKFGLLSGYHSGLVGSGAGESSKTRPLIESDRDDSVGGEIDRTRHPGHALSSQSTLPARTPELAARGRS